MNSLPIQYLHLESVIFLIFLGTVLLMQMARASEPGCYTQNARAQVRWLLIAFVMLALFFGSMLYNVSPLLAAELAVGFTLALLHPVNALCLCIHLLFLRPWEIVTENPLLQSLPRLLALLCFFSWLLHPEHHPKPTAQAMRGLKLLLGFSFWLFLTTFAAADIAETQADWFATYFKSLTIFVMCLFFIDSERSVWEVELTIMISTLALMVVGFYQFLSGGSASARLGTVGMFGNSNDLAAVVVMAIPFALVPVFNQVTSMAQQIVGLLFSGFSILVIWYTQSRGALLALLAQLLAFRVLNSSRVNWLRLALLVGVLGGGYFLALHHISRAAEEMQESQEDRISYWKAAVSMTVHHPIWGVGYDQFTARFGTHRSGATQTAHSSWLLAFAESGIPGGLLFVTFFLTVLRTAWRNRWRSPDQFYALAGYGVTMSFLSHTYTLYFYMLSGLVMASDSLKELPKDESETS